MHRHHRIFVLALLAFAWLCGNASVAHATPPQEAGLDEIRVAWTPRLILRRDLIGSPRLQHGPGLAAGALSYARTRSANAHRLELDLAAAMVRTQPDFEYLSLAEREPLMTAGSPLVYARIRYAYLRELPLGRERLALRLGPALDFDIQKLEYVHSPSSLGGYHGVFALDARAELELRLDTSARHRLRVGASVPVFAWVARSPYAINDDAQVYANVDHNGFKTFFRYIAGGQLQSWNRLQAVRLELRYDLRLHTHVALSAGLHARILANSVPRPLLAQDYGGSLGLTVLF